MMQDVDVNCLNDLRDDLLLHTLSFLPDTKHRVKTSPMTFFSICSPSSPTPSILLKRWQNLWVHQTAMSIVIDSKKNSIDHATEYVHIVDHCLHACRATVLENVHVVDQCLHACHAPVLQTLNLNLYYPSCNPAIDEARPFAKASACWIRFSSSLLICVLRLLGCTGHPQETACRLVELDPNRDGNYVLLSNVYALVGKWENVEKVRAIMRTSQMQKTQGCSAVGGIVHEFSVGDRLHPRLEEIYAAWDDLVKKLKLMGYEPNLSILLNNLDKKDKDEALYRHNEKLALPFALISSEGRSLIRIIKNLRICSNCHRAIELLSELEGREIIVRD